MAAPAVHPYLTTFDAATGITIVRLGFDPTMGYRVHQSWNYSCGAACLLCAALELGVIPVPATVAELEYRERAIYAVTSNNPRDTDPRTWRYSMPSNIVRCARDLGLPALVVAYDTRTMFWLERFFPNELPTLDNMDVLVRSGSPRSLPVLAENLRELRVLLGRDLRGNFGALHYVMIRPNYTVMEPAGCRNYNDIMGAKDALGLHGTGLSVFIGKG